MIYSRQTNILYKAVYATLYLEEYLVMNAQLFQNLFKVVIAYALEKLYRYCAIVERRKQIS